MSEIRRGYDQWSAVYDHDANPLVNLEESVVRERLGNVRGLRALDSGCGTGRHSLWLAEHGAEVTAVDFSEGMLAEARLKPGAERVHFLVHDLHRPLPFADATFDLVLSGLVLEHPSELTVYFNEARRVLRPSGRAIVSAMHPAMFLLDVQAQFRDPSSGEKVRPGSVPHTIGDMVMAAVRAGFRLDAVIERSPDAEFAERFPRAERFVGWPMLVVLQLSSEL
jgi:malonyl-CoA O-methyltransferase